MSTEVLHLIGALGGFGAVLLIRSRGWWYEPPKDEQAQDVRVKKFDAPVLEREPVMKPPIRKELPPLELD